MAKIKELLRNKQFKSLYLYVIVGGLATVVEWAAFWMLTEPVQLHYLLATSLAFALSTFANWYFGRVLVFKTRSGSVLREIASVYLASAVGLALNLIIMLILVQAFAVDEMPSKIAATALVFVYNYLVRKYLIYKEKD